MTLPLYRRLLGERFEHLPPRVRELHDVQDKSLWTGRADVERGRSMASRCLATVLGLPPSGRDQVLEVRFQAVKGREDWQRSFNGARFRSVQYERGGFLYERVGPTTFVFALETPADGLSLKLEGVRFVGVPLPRFAWPSVCTFECEREGRYCFQVEAALPMIGRVVRYAGWLERQPS